MSYQYITLRENPEIMQNAAEWFSSKWRVPIEAYIACIYKADAHHLLSKKVKGHNSRGVI